MAGRRSIELNGQALSGYDAVLVVTDHRAVDYRLVAQHAALVVDTRNVMERNGIRKANVIKG